MEDLEVKILKYLMKNTGGANSDVLAKYCGVSKNTIRSRIPALNETIKAEGLYIEAKPSSGYQLCVTEEEKADAFFSWLNHHMRSPLFGRNNDREYKVNYIIRRLLSAKSYVAIDFLCEELFYSKSSVKKDLEAVGVWFFDFNLRLKIKKNYGYYLEGSEWDKRIALLVQDKIFVNLPAELKEREKDYDYVMRMDMRKQYKWRKNVTALMNQNNKTAFPLIEFPLIYNYIPLIQTRRKYGKQILFTEMQKKALEESGLLTEARKILDYYHGVITADEAETEAYAMLLLVFRTVTDFSQITEKEAEEVRKDALEIMEWIRKEFPVLEIPDEAFMRKFACCWYGIRNKVLFDIMLDEENIRPLEPADLLIESLCRKISEYAQEKFQKKVKMRQFHSAYYLLKELWERTAARMFRYRMVVVSVYGYGYACYVANRIKSSYGFFVKEAAALEYTQLNQEVDKAYDFLVTDMRADMRPKTENCRVFGMEVFDDEKNQIPELDAYFRERIEIGKKSLLQCKSLPGAGKTKEEILREIAKDLAAEVPEEEIFLVLKKNSEYFRHPVYGETAFLTYGEPQREDIVKIYEYSPKVKWDGETVRRIVFFSYSGKDLEKLFYISRILKDFTSKR